MYLNSLCLEQPSMLTILLTVATHCTLNFKSSILETGILSLYKPQPSLTYPSRKNFIIKLYMSMSHVPCSNKQMGEERGTNGQCSDKVSKKQEHRETRHGG